MYNNYPDYFGGGTTTTSTAVGINELDEEDLQPATYQRRQSQPPNSTTTNPPSIVKPAASTEWLQQEQPPAFFSEATQDPFSSSNYHQPHYYTTDEEVTMGKDEEDSDAFNWFQNAPKANSQPVVQSPVVEINYESYSRDSNDIISCAKDGVSYTKDDLYNKQVTTTDYFQNHTTKSSIALPLSHSQQQQQAESVFAFQSPANEQNVINDYFSQATGNVNDATIQQSSYVDQSAFPHHDATQQDAQMLVSNFIVNPPYEQPPVESQQSNFTFPQQPIFTYDQPKETSYVEVGSYEQKGSGFDYQQPEESQSQFVFQQTEDSQFIYQQPEDSQTQFTYQQPEESQAQFVFQQPEVSQFTYQQQEESQQYGFSQQDQSYPLYDYNEQSQANLQQQSYNYDQAQTTANYQAPSMQSTQFQFSYEQSTQDSFNYFQPEDQQQQYQDNDNNVTAPIYYTEPSAVPPVSAPSEKNICSRCKFHNSSKVNFCGMCGQQLVEKLEVMNMLENLSISSNNSSSVALSTAAGNNSSSAATATAVVGAFGIYSTTSASVVKPPPSPIVAPTVITASPINPEQQKVHPTVSFGFGGKTFYTFPKTQVRYNATSPTKGTTKYSPDSVHIMSQPAKDIPPPLLAMKPKELAKILDAFPDSDDIITTMKLLLEHGPRFIQESKAKHKLVKEVLLREDYLNFGASSGTFFNSRFREALAAGDMKKAFTSALDDSDWLGAFLLAPMMKKEDSFELHKRFSDSLPKGDPLKLFIVLMDNLPLTDELMIELAQDWRQSVALCMTMNLPMLEKVLWTLSSHALEQDSLILQLLAGVEEPTFPTKEMSEFHEAIMHAHNPSYFKTDLLIDKIQVAERLAFDANATEASRKYLQVLTTCLKTSTRVVNPAILQRLKELEERLAVQEAASGKGGVSSVGWKPLQGLFDVLDRGLQKMAGVEPEVVSAKESNTQPTVYTFTEPSREYKQFNQSYDYASQPQATSQPVPYGDYYHKPESSYEATGSYYEQAQQSAGYEQQPSQPEEPQASYEQQPPYFYDQPTSNPYVQQTPYSNEPQAYSYEQPTSYPYEQQPVNSYVQPQTYEPITQPASSGFDAQNYYYGGQEYQPYGEQPTETYQTAQNQEQQQMPHGYYDSHAIGEKELPVVPTIKLSPVPPAVPMPSVSHHQLTNARDDFDDLGFGNKPLKATTSIESSSPVSSTKKSDATGSSSGVLGFFKKILPIGGGSSCNDAVNTSPSLSNKSNSTRANLGQESSFYYDEKVKRWVNKGEEDKVQTGLPPPPPKMGEASPSSGSMGDVSMMTPPLPPVNINSNNNTKRPSTLRSKYIDPFSTNISNNNNKEEEEKRTSSFVPPPVAQYDQPTAF